MRSFFANASKSSLKIGLLLFGVHLILAWWVILSLGLSGPDAQWQLVWIYFLPLDFPFSLLVYFSNNLFPDWSVGFLRYPMSDFRGFVLPSVVHGIIGPIWYFAVPVSISAMLGKWREYRLKGAKHG
jgi:hypothetical protein